MLLMRTLTATIAALGFVALAYLLVDDDRPVITTQKRIEHRVTQERIDAARKAINATEPRQCNWRDLFKEPKK